MRIRIFVILKNILYHFHMDILPKIFLTTMFLLSPFFEAQSSFNNKNLGNLQIHVGNWLEYPGQIRKTQNGDTNGFELAPYFATSFEYNVREHLQLIPELGYILQRSSENIDKNQFFARIDMAYFYRDFLRIRVGSSFMILNISSDGGEKELPNGPSTETYYRPSESQNAFNQTLDFGIEYIFDKKSIKLQSYTYAWNIAEERLTSFSMAFTYAIPIGSLL